VEFGADLFGGVVLDEHLDDLLHVEVDQLHALLLNRRAENKRLKVLFRNCEYLITFSMLTSVFSDQSELYNKNVCF
jgi:hypothetical protein